MGTDRESRCRQVKADGTRCEAGVQSGSAFCFFHDPAKAAEREAAHRAGGRAGRTKVLPPGTPDVQLASVADVITFLGESINQVRRGAIDPKVANAVGYLTATLLKALEQGDIEKRLAELERIVKGQDVPESPFEAGPAGELPAPPEGEEAAT